jgi:hypothetical protein
MYEYRCTRRELYYNSKCPGFKDLSARQGYYITADNLNAAYVKMKQLFPKEKYFDIQLWNKKFS